MFGLVAFTAAYYFAHAVYQSYISLFYQKIGCTSGQIGAIFAGVAVASMAAQVVFGALGDRFGHVRRLIAALTAVAAVLLLMMQNLRNFWAVFALSAAFGFAYAPIQPLGDAEILTSLSHRKKPFGPVRLAGVIAFALSSYAFGAWGNPQTAPLVAAMLLTVVIFATRGLPAGKRAAPDGPRYAFEPLRDRAFRMLLLFAIPLQITMSYYYAFFPTRFLLLAGSGGGSLGLAQFVSAVSEIPYLLVCDRVFRRWGAWRTLAVSAVLLAVRWLILGLSTSAWPAILSQLLHGPAYTSVAVSLAKYANARIPQSLSKSAQSMVALAGYGVARLLGNLLGGFLADAFGQETGFLICAGICLLALIAFFPVWRREEGGPPAKSGESPR